MDIKKFTDKALRAKTDKDELEKEYLDIQLQKQVNKIIEQYGDEPDHLRSIAVSLAHKVLKTRGQTDENISDTL